MRSGASADVLGDTVLGVWAHPDDEAFLSAGLMAAAARRGVRVVCVTATRGEEGSRDEDEWPSDRIGKIREAELLESLRILGVTEHRFLDYRDGACADVEPGEAIDRIRAVVEEVRPNTVLTFGPDGMTGHPDHRAVSGWATSAFEQAARPGARMYFATTTPDWAHRMVPRMNRLDIYGPGTPPVTPPEDLAIDFDLPEDLLELKERALGAHRSQVEVMYAALGPGFVREAFASEWFRAARNGRNE